MSLRLLCMASKPLDVTVSGSFMMRGRKLYEKTYPSGRTFHTGGTPTTVTERSGYLDSPGEAEIRGVEATKVHAAKGRVLRTACAG